MLWNQLNKETREHHITCVELFYRLHCLAPTANICEDIICHALLDPDKVSLAPVPPCHGRRLLSQSHLACPKQTVPTQAKSLLSAVSVLMSGGGLEAQSWKSQGAIAIPFRVLKNAVVSILRLTMETCPDSLKVGTCSLWSCL